MFATSIDTGTGLVMKFDSIKFAVVLLFISTAVSRADERPQTIVAFGDSTTASRGPLNIYTDVLRTELSVGGETVRVAIPESVETTPIRHDGGFSQMY